MLRLISSHFFRCLALDAYLSETKDTILQGILQLKLIKLLSRPFCPGHCTLGHDLDTIFKNIASWSFVQIKPKTCPECTEMMWWVSREVLFQEMVLSDSWKTLTMTVLYSIQTKAFETFWESVSIEEKLILWIKLILRIYSTEKSD